MRADVHEGPENMLQSEAGYIDARPHRQDRRKPLAPHGRTIHSGQNRLTCSIAVWLLSPVRDIPALFSRSRELGVSCNPEMATGRADVLSVNGTGAID